MPQKETLEAFLNNIPSWPSAIQKMAIGAFNTRTLEAKAKSISVAPEDTGELKNKTQTIKAKLTQNRITSGYVFLAHNKDYYYPKNVNEGIGQTGKPIRIHTEDGYNKNAQTHFAEAGPAAVKDELMNDLKKIVADSFGAL